jgi:hypothetical protein
MSFVNSFTHPLIGLFFPEPEGIRFPSREEVREKIDRDEQLKAHPFFKDKNISQLVADAFGDRCISQKDLDQGIRSIVSLCSNGHFLAQQDFDRYVRDLTKMLFSAHRSRL